MSLLTAISGLPGTAPARVHGVVVAIITNNRDPDGLGRVRLRFPWLSDSDESDWARVASFMAGKERGALFLPEVDDEVLVAFEHGDPRFPFVLGALWNGKDKPPADNADGKNALRMIRSRSGHEIRLVDADGGEKIEIVDKSGENKIVIDAVNRSVTVSAPNGKIRLEASQIEIEGSGPVKIRGATIDLN